MKWFATGIIEIARLSFGSSGKTIDIEWPRSPSRWKTVFRERFWKKLHLRLLAERFEVRYQQAGVTAQTKLWKCTRPGDNVHKQSQFNVEHLSSLLLAAIIAHSNGHIRELTALCTVNVRETHIHSELSECKKPRYQNHQLWCETKPGRTLIAGRFSTGLLLGIHRKSAVSINYQVAIW